MSKKLDTIFTRVDMHLHQYELQSLILILVLQSLLTRCLRDPIQVMPLGILAHMSKSFATPIKASDHHFKMLRIWNKNKFCFSPALFKDLEDPSPRRGCYYVYPSAEKCFFRIIKGRIHSSNDRDTEMPNHPFQTGRCFFLHQQDQHSAGEMLIKRGKHISSQ